MLPKCFSVRRHLYRQIVVSCLILFMVATACTATSQEPERSTFWLGFPIIKRDQWPKEINLAEDESLGSAFLLQLRRQALLIAARDELGAVTRDAFLDETAPENVTKVFDIKDFPKADPKYVDHRQFLAELEKLSRNEFTIELQKRGVKKQIVAPSEPKQDETNNTKKELAQIEKSLSEYALIPQFDAVRRTHTAIRKHGETPELLALLVHGYTQLQTQTNFAPRDSHRVFQARAMLYAQRLVAKYGETPENLSIRAAAWSLNNFHRLARLEFQSLSEKSLEIPQDSWIQAARYYADFDFKGLDSLLETDIPKEEQTFIKLLHYFLLDFSYQLDRAYGQSLLEDMPDSSSLYARVYAISTFDMIQAPDGSPFHEHLARRISPALRKMQDLPSLVKKAATTLNQTVRKSSSGLFGLFGSGGNSGPFPLEQYYIDLAKLIETLNTANISEDQEEPSLQALGMLLKDEAMQSVQYLANGLSGRNGASENIIIPALPVLESHPSIDFLGARMRDAGLRAPYLTRVTLEAKDIPYNLFSQHAYGFHGNKNEAPSFGRIYSPFYFAQLYSDRENVRDMIKYHLNVVVDYPKHKPYFLADWLLKLCPNNSFAVAIHLSRTPDIKLEDLKVYLEKDRDTAPIITQTIVELLLNRNHEDELLELLDSGLELELDNIMTSQLTTFYLRQNRPDDAMTVFRKHIDSPDSDRGLQRYNDTLKIGQILFQQGKFKEALPYYQRAAQTHSAWGLSAMSQYHEIMGNFDEAERYLLREMRSYPRSGPFAWWASCYRFNSPDLQEATDMVLERFQRFKNAEFSDLETKHNNWMYHYQVIYPCYCMDMPMPKRLGPEPLPWEFFVTANGAIGFLAWLDEKEKKETQKAKELLFYMRELGFLAHPQSLFLEFQRAAKVPQRQYVYHPYQMFAALIQADQLSDSPGELDPDEVEFLIRSSFDHDLQPSIAPWILYFFGRYYEFCGKKEEALDCYRRVLGFRVDFDYFLRSLTIKELRKYDLSDEEYLQYSQGDPRIPRFKISYSIPDVVCRMHFRDYSESPSDSVLQRPVAQNSASATDFGKTIPLNSGTYKVTKTLFRGDAIPENETVLYWCVPPEKHKNPEWIFQGIAGLWSFPTSLQEPRDDGAYPLLYGELPALASFHDDHLVLAISLKKDEEPDSLTPSPESNFMRIEMKRVADYHIEEPLHSTPDNEDSLHEVSENIAPPGSPASTVPGNNPADSPAWTNPVFLVALGVICIALLFLLRRLRMKKREL